MIFQAIAEGILAGLILSVFVGPMFFSMLQLGVEHGFKAAFALALGQWISDIFYIFLAFWGAIWVEDIIQDAEKQANFILYSGSIGGVMLILFGLGLLLTRSISTKGNDKIGKITHQISLKAYLAYTSQGIIINTVNPTPLLFWMGLMAFAINSDYSGPSTFALYFSVMSIVILTDLIKILLAKRIRQKIDVKHFLTVRRLAGVVLFGFGLFLVIKVNYF